MAAPFRHPRFHQALKNPVELVERAGAELRRSDLRLAKRISNPAARCRSSAKRPRELAAKAVMLQNTSKQSERMMPAGNIGEFSVLLAAVR